MGVYYADPLMHPVKVNFTDVPLSTGARKSRHFLSTTKRKRGNLIVSEVKSVIASLSILSRVVCVRCFLNRTFISIAHLACKK